MKTVFSAFLFTVLVWSAPAAAQEIREDRLQIRAVGGWAVFGDSIHHGVVGAMMDLRLVAGLRLGPEFLYNVGPGKDRDISVVPTVSYDFRRLKRVAPFMSGGYGLIRHTDGGRSSNSFTFGLSGGAKIAISDRLFIAPEFRFGWEPWTRALVGIGYRF